MSNYSELRQQADRVWQSYVKPARSHIAVTVSTDSHARDGAATLHEIQRQIAARKLAVDVGITSSIGLSYLEPTIVVTRTDASRVLYGPVTADRVGELLDQLVSNGVHRGLAIGLLAGTVDGVAPIGEHVYFKGQVRRLMATMGLTDPENIDHAIANDAYKGLDRALAMEPDAIVKEVLDSTLRGRSGSDFPTGRKWDFLRGARGGPKYLICNADEGDPGAFINRALMEGDPHSVVEGMIIAAHTTGATYGFVYIREEYPLCVARMKKAIVDAHVRGLLGLGILGSKLNYDMRVVTGAGSYVCGEESGLISSIQDSRGMPRIRPPFPAQAGVFGLPTNVNNVETYADAALVLRNGLDWYGEVGTQRNHSTKMCSLSGDIQRPGVLEVPLGTPTGDIVLGIGGGVDEGHMLKALQPGGPLAGIIGLNALDLPLEPEEYRPTGTLMGGGGIVLCDETTCIVDLCVYFEWFCEDESCGRCTTCHGGTQRLTEIFRRISNGEGKMSDLDLIQLLADSLRWSNCVHGQAAPTPVSNSLQNFRDEIMTHIQEKRCPTQVCQGLIRYEVDAAHDMEVAEGAAICPTGAIKEQDGHYAIDQNLCIKCDACREVNPRAIRLVDSMTVVT
ncbi:MAG: NADH-ubiquinone oxidoreductase-F iron-sulfur binding region domain-containing protein [Dehalococcoidia bacterium]